MDGYGKRVLIADDDDHARELLAALLDQNGYAVHMARDGAEALEELQRRQFDVVVTDYQMPRVNGLQLLAHSRIVCPHTPVVFISGTLSDMAESAARQGAVACISKPYDVEALLEIVKTAGRHLPKKEG